MKEKQTDINYKKMANALRIGLGLVFVSGGLNKLILLLGASTKAGMIENYLGSLGYVNSFFQDFLFHQMPISPEAFLMSLSAFEFLSGLSLVIGFLVRPIALFYGFLMWSFVFSLPVHTVPGAEAAALETYTSPAILVQIRDVALSGLMFALYILGPGNYALDYKLLKLKECQESRGHSVLLLLRLSMSVVFLVGGVFIGKDHIQSFGVPGILLVLIGVLTVLGAKMRFVAALMAGVFIYYMLSKFSVEKSVIGNLNSIKREIAFLAVSLILLVTGGGQAYTLSDLKNRIAFAVGR